MMETSCINIIICDDELQICKLIQRKLLEYGIHRDVEIRTEIFTDAGEMLKAVRENVDLLILDVEMPGMDGMTAASKIRRENPDVNIIFLSGHREYVFESFRVQAFRYLLKPLKDEDLEEAMDAIFVHRKNETCLEYNFLGENWSIPYRDILYLEGMRGKIWIHCSGGKIYRWRGAMAPVSEDLKKHGFFMTHQSYIVNMHRITRFNFKEVELDGEVTVPISKLRLNDFKKEYVKKFSGGGELR